MRFVKSDSSPLVKVLRNVVLIMFIVIFISIVYNFRNRESDTESALIAEATASREFKGVFIRDEQVRTYSGSGVLSYNVTDGGKLGNGSVIAEVYPDENQISINRKIDSLTKELDILKKSRIPELLNRLSHRIFRRLSRKITAVLSYAEICRIMIPLKWLRIICLSI